MVEAHHNNDIYPRHGAAIVALRRLDDPGVSKFLNDKNEFIVTNAARAINDDAQIKEALPALAQMLDQHHFTNEPLIRRAINACLYGGRPEDAQRLATFSAQKNRPVQMRAEAIKTLGVWSDPSTLDRVTGRFRGNIHHDTTVARNAFATVIDQLLDNNSHADIKVASSEAISRLNYQPASPALLAMVKSDPSPEARIAALKALQQLGYHNLGAAVDIALKDPRKDVRMKVLGMVPSMNLSQKNIVGPLKYILVHGSYIEQQSALNALGKINSDDSNRILSDQLDKLIADDLAPEIQLDVLEAARQTGRQPLLAKVKQYESGKPDHDITTSYREALRGGHSDQGRRIFYRNEGAQCIRCHALGDQGGNVYLISAPC